MEIYKPRMDGLAVPGDGVADTIGTITTSIRVAQNMFLAGLPCWLIRPSKSFSDQKIFLIREVFHPKNYVVLEPHIFNYPVIFKGLATDLLKYHAIKIFARNFLCSKDPFAMSGTPLSLAVAPQPFTSSTPAVASTSATQHSTGKDSCRPIRKPAKSRGAGKFSVLIYRYVIILNRF